MEFLRGYWLISSSSVPAIGDCFFSSQVRRGLFGYVVLPSAVVFAALGAIFLFTLTLPDAVTVVGTRNKRTTPL